MTLAKRIKISKAEVGMQVMFCEDKSFLKALESFCQNYSIPLGVWSFSQKFLIEPPMQIIFKWFDKNILLLFNDNEEGISHLAKRDDLDKFHLIALVFPYSIEDLTEEGCKSLALMVGEKANILVFSKKRRTLSFLFARLLDPNDLRNLFLKLFKTLKSLEMDRIIYF